MHVRDRVVQLLQDELGVGGPGRGSVDSRHFDCKKNRQLGVVHKWRHNIGGEGLQIFDESFCKKHDVIYGWHLAST